MTFKQLLATGGMSALAAALAVTALPAPAAASAERPRMHERQERDHSRGNGERRGHREAPQQRQAPQQREAQQQRQVAQQRQAAVQQRSPQSHDRSDRRGRDWNRGDRHSDAGTARNGQAWNRSQQSIQRQEWDRRGDGQRTTERNRTYRDTSRNATYRSNHDRDSYRDRHRSDNNWRDGNRDHHRWDRTWRNNNRYNWYSYRNQYRDRYRLGRYYSPYRNYRYSRIGIGFGLSSLFYSSRYWINDPWYYRLPPAYGNYRWVRYYDDALLVDIYTGEVVDVIYDFFW